MRFSIPQKSPRGPGTLPQAKILSPGLHRHQNALVSAAWLSRLSSWTTGHTPSQGGFSARFSFEAVDAGPFDTSGSAAKRAPGAGWGRHCRRQDPRQVPRRTSPQAAGFRSGFPSRVKAFGRRSSSSSEGVCMA